MTHTQYEHNGNAPPPPRLVPLPCDLRPSDSRPKYALHALHNVEKLCAQNPGSACDVHLVVRHAVKAWLVLSSRCARRDA